MLPVYHLGNGRLVRIAHFSQHKQTHNFARRNRLPARMALQTPFVPAIVTPWKQDLNGIDEDSFRSYLKFLWSAGFEDIIVNGSTGEFPSMTLDEREHVAEVARNTWPGRQVVNISCCNVEDTLRLLKHAQHGRGSPKGNRLIADGVLLLPPYYFAASSQEGLETFFRAILKEASLPVYLYNFPANTGALISPELYAKLGKEFPHLQGIKNTFNDLPLSKRFKDALPDKQVYVGHDPSCLECLEQGFDGAIAATASMDPESLLGVAKAFKDGNHAKAKQHMAKLNKWNSFVAEHDINVFSAVKVGISHHLPGFPLVVRPPLKEASEKEVKSLLHLLGSHKSHSTDAQK